MTQILELSDKDLRAAVMTMLYEVKVLNGEVLRRIEI